MTKPGTGLLGGGYNVPMSLVSRFAQSDLHPDPETIESVRAFVRWHWIDEDACTLSDDDDIPLRTYLLELKHKGLAFEDRRRILGSILLFYRWGRACNLVETIPEVSFVSRFEREKIQRRKEIFPDNPEAYEIARLEALNNLVGKLNRAVEIKEVLSSTLDTVLEALNLETGWIFLLPVEGSPFHPPYQFPPHDFALAAASGLPPGLEQNERTFLCSPGDCHCQDFFRSGGMKRAVNVVDCSRLDRSAQAEGDNQGLRFHASVPIFFAGKPGGIINVAAEDWQILTASDLQILSLIGAQVSEALERARLFDLTQAQQRRLESELQLARDVQASLLPQEVPDLPGFTIAVEWQAAREMAGDFYDLIEFGGGCFGIVAADVSDKGAPAALFMALAGSLIRTSASPEKNPAETLGEVNRRILAHSRSGMFVTVFYAILDTNTYSLTYASAGQDPPLLRRSSRKIEKIMPTGPLIGFFPELQISHGNLHFDKGDVLLIYTDGVVDALNKNNEHFELERLQASLKNARGGTAPQILAELSADLQDFTGGAPPFDDLTCLVLVCNR